MGITDDGIRSLHRCKKINWVSLKGTQVTDDGLIYFFTHSKFLLYLDLSTCKVVQLIVMIILKITDDSVAEIAYSCPHLRSLALGGCDK